ncbi:MAG TPA: hypothetical protein VM243_00305 [Phycisphaerae bacterium]|nr:hypothetical protein [Phycisphaerae bacterium]
MIEFKADCGHTIRAKDEDEGKVVRCSYCGRETQVPMTEANGLDSLFAEVESSEDQAGAAVSRKTRRAMKRSGVSVGTARRGPGFNPLAVAMKMAYAAGIIIVLILASNYAYRYWSALDSGRKEQRSGVSKEGSVSEPAPGGKHQDRGRGLLAAKLSKKSGGIYVTSVPVADQVRVRRREPGESGVSASELFADPELETCKANKPIELRAGQYDVVVVVKVSDMNLMDYPGYVALRRKIDQGTCVPAMLDGFFMPDGAVEVGTLRVPNLGPLLYRRYERQVIGKDWAPLTSLFLPYGPVSGMAKYLPRKESYGFDEAYAKRELTYYGVPEQDQKYLTDTLRRVGMAVYKVPGELPYRCFGINLTDGSIVTTYCEDPRPPGARGGGVAPGPLDGAVMTGLP